MACGISLVNTCRRIVSQIFRFFYLGVYVVVNFLSQVIFIFLLFLGMIMYANEV